MSYLRDKKASAGSHDAGKDDGGAPEQKEEILWKRKPLTCLNPDRVESFVTGPYLDRNCAPVEEGVYWNSGGENSFFANSRKGDLHATFFDEPRTLKRKGVLEARVDDELVFPKPPIRADETQGAGTTKRTRIRRKGGGCSFCHHNESCSCCSP